jgi:hypothetical protein
MKQMKTTQILAPTPAPSILSGYTGHRRPALSPLTLALPALSILAVMSSGLLTGCASSSPPMTHVDRPMMPNRAVAVYQGEIPNTVVTSTPLCARGELLLPAGTTLKFSYPTPYPYSPWRPVYRLQLPGKTAWWPATAVLSKSGIAYFSYFAVPTKNLEAFRRACVKNPSDCCPPPPGQYGTDKNPVRPHR